MHDHYSDAEIKELRKLTSEISEKCGFPITLDKLIQSWEVFVSECENGYSDLIDEYTNDLSSRSLIADIMGRVSSAFAAKIISRVNESDKKFLEVTKPISEPLMNVSDKPTEIEKMLYFRIPKKCIGDLKENLMDMKILEADKIDDAGTPRTG